MKAKLNAPAPWGFRHREGMRKPQPQGRLGGFGESGLTILPPGQTHSLKSSCRFWWDSNFSKNSQLLERRPVCISESGGCLSGWEWSYSLKLNYSDDLRTGKTHNSKSRNLTSHCPWVWDSLGRQLWGFGRLLAERVACRRSRRGSRGHNLTVGGRTTLEFDSSKPDVNRWICL